MDKKPRKPKTPAPEKAPEIQEATLYPCPKQPCNYEHKDIAIVRAHVGYQHQQETVATNDQWRAGLPPNQPWVTITDPEEIRRCKCRMHKAPFGGKKKGPSGTGVTSADGTTIRPADAPKAARKKKKPPTLTATLTADLLKNQPGLVLSRLPKVKEGAGIPAAEIRRPEDVPLRRRGEECIQAKHIGMAKEALHARQIDTTQE